MELRPVLQPRLLSVKRYLCGAAQLIVSGYLARKFELVTCTLSEILILRYPIGAVRCESMLVEEFFMGTAAR